MKIIGFTVLLLLSSYAYADNCNRFVSDELSLRGYGDFSHPTIKKDVTDNRYYIFSNNKNFKIQYDPGSDNKNPSVYIESPNIIGARSVDTKTIYLDTNCNVTGVRVSTLGGDLTVDPTFCKKAEALGNLPVKDFFNAASKLISSSKVKTNSCSGPAANLELCDAYKGKFGNYDNLSSIPNSKVQR